MELIAQKRPILIILSPPCTVFSQLFNLSMHKHDPDELAAQTQEGPDLWQFAIKIAIIQYDAARAFLLEQRLGARSWQTPEAQELLRRPGVYVFAVDLCQFGFVANGMPAEKPTRLVTNLKALVRVLHRRCPRHHVHQPLLSGTAAAAARDTRPFCRAILRGLRQHLQTLGIFFHGLASGSEDSSLLEPLRVAASKTGAALASATVDFLKAESDFQMEWMQMHLSAQDFGGGSRFDRIPSPRDASATTATTASTWLQSDRLPSHRDVPATTATTATASKWLQSDRLPSHPDVPATTATTASTWQFPSGRIFGPRQELDQPGFEDPVTQRAGRELRPVGQDASVQRQAQRLPSARPPEDDDIHIPADQQRELYRLHRNLGHPDNQAFIRALNHAGVRDEVIRWTKKKFHCPLCEAKQCPTAPRPGHLHRALEFNQVVGIDTMFYQRDVSHAELRVLGLGTPGGGDVGGQNRQARLRDFLQVLAEALRPPFNPGRGPRH